MKPLRSSLALDLISITERVFCFAVKPIVTAVVLLLPVAHVFAAPDLDSFDTDPKIGNAWTQYAYYLKDAATARWNNAEGDLDLVKAAGNDGIGLYRTDSKRSATDPVTMTVKSLVRSDGRWGFLGLMITSAAEQDYLTGTGDSYTLAVVPVDTKGLVRFEVRRTYADGTDHFQLFVSKNIQFDGPYRLDILRDGDNYVFKVNGTALYTTTGRGADDYDTESKDAMIHYQMVFAGDAAMTAKVDDFGKLPADAPAPKPMPTEVVELLTSVNQADAIRAQLQSRSGRLRDWVSTITIADRKRDAQGDLLPLQPYDETIRRGMSFLLDDHLQWFKGAADTLVDEEGRTRMPWFYYSNLQQNGVPFPSSVDRFVSYPAFHHSMLIRTFIRYSEFTEDERALKLAIELADWNIAHSTPADWPYAGLPYSTFQEKKPGGFKDKTGLMPDKAAIMALAYLDLHEVSGEVRFKQAAEAIAKSLSLRQRADGTWPFRVDPKTERVIEEYTSSVIYAVMLFERLDELNGNADYRPSRDRAWNWLWNGPIKTKEFRGFYEDIPPSPHGRTNYDCLDTIRYLLANRTEDNGYLAAAKDLNAWVQEVFMDKIPGFEPAEGIREQLQCNVVMGIHSLNWASMLLDLAEATGDEAMRHRAIQTANYITYYLQPDNRILVGFRYSQWWYSCHTGVILYLFDFLGNAEEQAKAAVPDEQVVDQRLQDGLEWMAEHPPVFKGTSMDLVRAYMDLASGKATEPGPINEALGAYYKDFLKDPKADPDKPHILGPRPPAVAIQLYLKPRYHSLLTPDSVKAIETMCWRMVYRHSSILENHEHPANNPTKTPWIITASENHDALQRSGILLSLQVLMKAGAPYGPDAKLYDGHTVDEHYREWLKWFPEFYHARIREGLICEMAHPTSYGAATIRCVYEIEDLTDDAAVKRAARDFLDVYWATVACEFEPRTGIRGGLTMTRCKGATSVSGTNYWARSLLYAYGWTDVRTDPTGASHMVGMHFSCGYRPPEILRAIARDADRAPYLGVSRRFGRGGHWDRGFYQVLFDDGDARNSYLRRDIWYTKDYTMSVLSLDPARRFIELVNQNRVMGVSFSHDIDDRLVVEAGTNPVDYGTTNSKGVLGAMGPNCLIAARDPNAKDSPAKTTRIFVSDGALWDNRAEDDAWIFTRAGDGYAALRIAGDKGYTLTPSPHNNGFYLDFNDIWAPVVIQTGQAGKFESFDAFKAAVKAQPFTYTKGKLTYNSLSGETYDYWSNSKKLPTINGEPIDLNPPFTYDYPYLKMKRGTDTVTISYPGHPDYVITP